MYEIVKENENNIVDYVNVNTKAMKETYQGIVNDDFLKMINSQEEKNKMIELHKLRINDPKDESFILYIDNEPGGIIRVGSSRINNYLDYGELRAIYLLKKYQKQGYGKILFNYAKKELIKMGYYDMVLDCIIDNPTNGFYQHFGGKIVGNKTVLMGREEIKENIYIFKLGDNMDNYLIGVKNEKKINTI